MDSLIDKLVSAKVREKAGPTSSSRFDYQKDWSICRLIEEHKTSSDYLVLFDYHEDLVIMDSEHNPKKISFYQIKGSKKGTWTLKGLLKSQTSKEGKSLLSIIGKLYDCKAKFDLETTSLNFVSNGRYSKLNLKDKSDSFSKDQICVIELTDEDQKKIRETLKKEHNLQNDPIFEDFMFLKVLDLSLNDSPNHTSGIISAYLADTYPKQKFNPTTVYRMLFDEVKRRANYSKDFLNFHDLIANKAIGRSEFEKILQRTGITKDYDGIWIRVEGLLANEGMVFQSIKKIHREWKTMEIERMNPNNNYLNKIIVQIENEAVALSKAGQLENLTLRNSVDIIQSSFLSKLTEKINYNEDYLRAIIISVIYEQ